MSLPSIVLASSSPRRQEILGSSGLLFSTASAQGPETDDPSLGLAGLVLTNAAAKAREIAESYPQSIVIGADTLVWLNDQPLGKPADLKEARQMLERLSDCWHEVATGVHLHQLEPPRQLGFHEVTRVRFHSLDEPTITAYLKRVDVLDKAGAYALQEHGEMLVKSVEGSRQNVIGLPLERTLAALRCFDERLISQS